MAYVSADDKFNVQYDVLTYKIDATTNSKMVYRASTALNRGLNPAYFSGNDTKIVNILNKFYRDIDVAKNTASSVAGKFNPVVLDTDTPDGQDLLNKMRIATGKQTLAESVLALANGEIGGLAFLNPSDDTDGFSIVYDAKKGEFVLKESAPKIDQNLVLFDEQAAYENYLRDRVCKVGQIGYFNNKHYTVTATTSTREELDKYSKYTVLENKYLNISTPDNVSDVDNLTIADATDKFVIELSNPELNKSYTILFDGSCDVRIAYYKEGNKTEVPSVSTLTDKAVFSVMDADVKKVYIEFSVVGGKNTNFARVGVGSSQVPVNEWKEFGSADDSYTRTNVITNKNIGLDSDYVPNGKIQDLLDDLLYAYAKPELEATIADFNRVYELQSGSISSANLELAISGGSKTSFDIEVTKKSDGSQIAQVSGATQGKRTIVCNFNTPITSSETIVVKIDDGVQTISKEISVKFQNPIYYGVLDSSFEESNITGLSKTVNYDKVFTGTFTSNALRTVIAYPKSLGEKYKLRDQNGFLLNGSYVKLEKTINGIDYIILYNEDKSTLDNFEITISFL